MATHSLASVEGLEAFHNIVVPNAPRITAAILLGDLFNLWLLGCLTVQCYVYYVDSFYQDRISLRCLVTFVFLFELAQTGIIVRDAFVLFCLQWGNPAVLSDARLSWLALPIFGGTMSCVVQLFYAWRISVFTQRRWVPAAICVLSLAQWGGSLATGITHVINKLHVTELSKTFKSTSLWLGGTALCDVIIATSMVAYLIQSKSGIRRTDLLLNKIMLLTVGSGLICAVLAIVDLVLFLALRSSNFHLTPAIILSKLYSNALIMVLNQRKRFRTFDEKGPLSTQTTPSIGRFTRPKDPSAIVIAVPRQNNTFETNISIPMDNVQHDRQGDDADTFTKHDTS